MNNVDGQPLEDEVCCYLACVVPRAMAKHNKMRNNIVLPAHYDVYIDLYGTVKANVV